MNDDRSASTENLLRHEASPYLLQHKENPVAWRAWGPDALAEAKRTGKPILLSVGYAACHWCHVMAHESFEDEATAALMNRLFVNIKVDREERPEIDQIYMSALHALGEQGGWPLTMFLTPDGEPIWGGTYFPKIARYGRPAFVDVIEEVARIFADEPDKVAQTRRHLLDHLNKQPAGDGVALDRPLLDRAASRLFGLIDPEFGGTRGAPKFPNASLFEFLWRAGKRAGDSRYLDAVILTLRSIANGGIYDHVGGGFARYSVDDRWLVPHFEKMLYDNAQLIELMTFASLETGDPLFRSRIEETAAWLGREMMTEGGAFAASLDADSEGHEGKFYVWTFDEVMDVLGPEEGPLFAEAYDITPAGNWEGVSIPNRIGKPPLLPEDDRRMAAARDKLLDRRSSRVRPMTDDKVLADWNGLMIAALALAGSTFDKPDWIAKAERAFRFVSESMMHGDRLAHSYRDDKLVFPGLATDYAAMIKAALALYSATFDRAYLDRAQSLAATLHQHHWDTGEAGYFLSADDAEALIVRLKSAQDDATPSANSLMGSNLIRLWRLTGKDEYRHDADALIAASAPAVAGNLFATTGVLNALDLRLGAVDIVIVRPTGADARALLAVARQHGTQNAILSLHDESAELPLGHPAAGKRPVDGRVTAYVCRGEVCSLPVTAADQLGQLLA